MNTAFRVVNVVVTAALDRQIDLHSLRKKFPNQVIHDPEIYRGRVAYYKSKCMEGKVSIFHSGKMISTGTKSIERATRELKYVAIHLNSRLIAKPKTQSIVATADFETPIDLESFLNRLHKERPFHAIYEPEQFPGAIVKFPIDEENEATILLFASGKLVSAGLTNLGLIRKAIDSIESRITP